jgi:hypothetical protein
MSLDINPSPLRVLPFGKGRNIFLSKGSTEERGDGLKITNYKN